MDFSLKQPKERLAHLDGLRGFAFLCVYLHHGRHFQVDPSASGLFAQLMRGYNWFCSMGWVGVMLFFCLSAYLVTSQLLAEEKCYGRFNWGAFQIRRIFRLWPLYFFVMLLGMVEIHFSDPVGFFHINDYLPHYFLYVGTFTANLFVAYDVFGYTPGMSPMWSICIEQQFYLVWASLLLLIRTPRARLIFLVVTLVGGILYRAHRMYHSTVNYEFYLHSLCQLDALVFGALIALYFARFPSTTSAKGALILWAGIALLCITGLSVGDFAKHFYTLSYTALALACGCFLLASFKCHAWRSILSTKLLMFIGRLSYGMYVMHFFCNIYLYPRILPASFMQYGPVFGFLMLPVLMSVAWMLHLLIERPANRLRNKILKKCGMTQHPVRQITQVA